MVMEKKFLKGNPLKDISEYDFPGLRRALSLGQENVIQEISDSMLLGRGGAGFPTGTKWSLALEQAGDKKYFICNADEGEPGTFKDRFLLEERPLKVLEGLMIGAYAVGADEGFIYIRGEYDLPIKIFREILEDARDEGILGKNIFGSDFDFDLTLVRGAGAYVCGDETSLINSIEGKRGISRIKPPYPIQEGLFGNPTVVNNVESLACAAEIINKGAGEFVALGTDNSRGTKLVSLSGDINLPGVYEIEFGCGTLEEIINDLGGGVSYGNKPKFVIPGGLSTAALLPEELNCGYSYEDIEEAGSSLGSGAIIVVGESRDLVEILLKVSRFYMDETCGTCFPCREGNKQINFMLNQHKNKKFTRQEVEIIKDIGDAIAAAARCGLGQTSLSLIESIFDKFPEELIEEVRHSEKVRNR